MGRTVEKNRSPKSVRIRTELTPPQLLAQDDHGRRPRFFLFRKKGSAEKRLNAQDVEQIRRDPPTADACSAAVTRDRVGLPVVNVDIDQARFMDGLSIVLEVRIGEIADTAASLIGGKSGDELVRIRVRKGPYEHAIDEAEESGIRGDPDRKREHRGGCERRPLRERPHRELEIRKDFQHRAISFAIWNRGAHRVFSVHGSPLALDLEDILEGQTQRVQKFLAGLWG